MTSWLWTKQHSYFDDDRAASDIDYDEEYLPLLEKTRSRDAVNPVHRFVLIFAIILALLLLMDLASTAALLVVAFSLDEPPEVMQPADPMLPLSSRTSAVQTTMTITGICMSVGEILAFCIGFIMVVLAIHFPTWYKRDTASGSDNSMMLLMASMLRSDDSAAARSATEQQQQSTAWSLCTTALCNVPLATYSTVYVVVRMILLLLLYVCRQ